MARSRRRSAEAVSSLAAVTAPAAASSGLSHAGASSTGKCLAMNPAARGLATIRDDPLNPGAQVAPSTPSLTANPAGRKYPSEALTSALDPRDRNKGWSTSSLYTGYNTSSATGWPFPWPTTPAPALARPVTGRPSGSRSGGAGSPTRSARGHIE